MWRFLNAEGRIEPSDGTLMCSYHGWRFDGEGACTDIPQSLDAKANAAACSNPRSCAISHPTQVPLLSFPWGGVLVVFAEVEDRVSATAGLLLCCEGRPGCALKALRLMCR